MFTLGYKTPKPRPQSHQKLSSNVLHFRIQPVEQVHALLVHGKHNAATQDQPRQPRQGTAPKGQHALLLEDHGRAADRVPVLLAGLDALHPRLDGVQGLRDKHRHQPGQAAHGKGAHGAELLPRRRVRLGHLLEKGVRAEAGGAVGSLARRRRHEALEEAADAAFARNDGHGVEEPAHPGFGGLFVVDAARQQGRCVSAGRFGRGDCTRSKNVQGRLDALRRRHGQQ